jgi:hypothetical protein
MVSGERTRPRVLIFGALAEILLIDNRSRLRESLPIGEGANRSTRGACAPRNFAVAWKPPLLGL